MKRIKAIYLDMSVAVAVNLIIGIDSAMAAAPTPPRQGTIGHQLTTLTDEVSNAGPLLVSLFGVIGIGLLGFGGMGLYKYFKTEGGGQGQSIKGPLTAMVVGVILISLAVFKGLASQSLLGKEGTIHFIGTSGGTF